MKMIFINNNKMSSLKEDLLYFFSIIAAFLAIMFTDGSEMYDFLSLPKASPELYLMIFSCFLILNSLINRCLLIPSVAEDKKKAANDILLVSSEQHLVIALVNISALLYARQNHKQLCTDEKITHIMVWFIFSRVCNLVGVFANRASGWDSWTTFGNAISMFTMGISLGMTTGFDTFRLL